jgi:hypothetical protein
LRYQGQEYIEQARVHLGTPQAREDIRRRKTWIEGVIADAKSHHGLSRAKCRGLTAMTIQALLVASAQNIKKLAANRSPAGLANSILVHPVHSALPHRPDNLGLTRFPSLDTGSATAPE